MSVCRALGLFVAIALVGCSSVGNLYDRWFGSRPAAKPAPLVAFTPSAQARIAWQANVGGAERNVFFPAVSGNIVYAAGAAGQVAAFDVKSGKPVSRIDAGQRLSSGVGAGGSLVVVGTAKGEVMAFDAGGKRLWRAALSGEVLAPPAVEGA